MNINTQTDTQNNALSVASSEPGLNLDALDSEGNAELHIACKKGDIDSVTRLLANGANIETKNKHGDSALHIASSRAFLDIVNLLLEKNAQVDSQNNLQETPVQLACWHGNLKEAQALRMKGADINNMGGPNGSALHLASANNHVEIVHWLLDNGAEVDQEDRMNQTAIFEACHKGHLGVVQALLAKNANVNKKDKKGISPLILCTLSGKINIAEELLKYKALVDTEDDKGFTPLHLASASGRLEFVKLFLANGADRNKQTKMLDSPLHVAAATLQLDVVKLLVEQEGITIDSENIRGNAPLMNACMKGSLEIAEVLIAKDANVNKKNKRKTTPLSHVSSIGNLSLVKLLLENNADVDCEDEDQYTPLFHACREGHLDVTKKLIAKGANVNKKGHAGFRPLHFAVGAKNLDIVHELIGAKADVNIQTDNGFTPLHFACLKNSIDQATCLLNAGADVNKQNGLGETALIIAVVKGFPTLVKLLIERNPKEEQFFKFFADTSILHKLFSDDYLLEAKMLAELFLRLSKNCDVTFKTKKGATALKGLISAEAALTKKVENILKIIFSDFGAMEEILKKYDGSNKILFDFKLNAEQLISHPQNKPSANPLAIPLLLDDRPLAYAIASKLNSADFLSMCSSLEKSFPKVPVAKFLFDTFITRPEVFQPTLPNDHIKALFGFLREKIDVCQRNEDLTTPLYKMLFAYEKESFLDQDAQSHVKKFEKEHAAKIVAALFSDFPSLTKRISEHLNDGLFSHFTEHPEELLSSNNQKANPFEFVFLFNDFSLARKLASHISKDGFHAFKLDLEKSYPKSNASEFMFNVEYDVNASHSGKILSGKIPAKPQGSEPNDFVILFNSINFSNPDAAFFADPVHILGRNKTHDDLKKVISDFVNKVKARKGIQGDHAEESFARKEFYDTLENGICGLAHFFQKTPSSTKVEEQKIRVMREFIKDVVYCGPKVRATTVRQYNNVVRNYEPTFDNLLYSKTTDLRSLIADSVVPMNDQNVHDYLLLVKYVGKDLGLAESAELSEFDDLFAHSGRGINPAKIKKSFSAIYTPFAIFTHVQNEITNDEEFREQYATWWQKNAPQSFKGEPLDPNDVVVEKGQTVEEVIDAVRRQNFVLEEVYENVRENRFKLSYMAESLQTLGVIQRAVSFKTE